MSARLVMVSHAAFLFSLSYLSYLHHVSNAVLLLPKTKSDFLRLGIKWEDNTNKDLRMLVPLARYGAWRIKNSKQENEQCNQDV